MARKTYYEILGVTVKASSDEIRQAYRRLALIEHPDRSTHRDATDRFMRITEAYETLRDAELRRRYDVTLMAAVSAPKKTDGSARSVRTNPGPELARLAALFSRGRLDEAEHLAEKIVASFPREAMAYAILGDIARARGQLANASKYYAYAVQMDPRNATYNSRYLDLLGTSPDGKQRTSSTVGVAPIGVLFIVSMLSCIYLAVGREKPLFPLVSAISTLTLGSLCMLFLCGVVMGVCLSLGRIVDRFSAVNINSLGGVSPNVALASVAVASFWAAVIIYAFLGAINRSYNFSTTRLIFGSIAVLLMLVLGSLLSSTLNPGQIAFWGGNIVYVGGICGWMVSDSFRR
ncbi:MAG: DnaJ domain-containing protein [Fimbriimonadaceae bacterium]